MKKLAFVAAAVALPFAIAHSAQAMDLYAGASVVGSSYNTLKTKNYFSNKGSISHNGDLSNGLGILARGGSKFGNFRAELELGYRDTSVDSLTGQTTLTGVSGDVDVWTAMINGAYDIDLGYAVKPFVTAGVGALYADGEVNYTDTDSQARYEDGEAVTIAGQLGLGASYALTSEVDLIGSYSFLAAPSAELGVNQYFQIHSAQIGLNYNF